MATTVADRAVLDTNVLLTASDTSRDGHQRARQILDGRGSRTTVLYTTGQILREYLVVATRPPQRNGLGLSRQDAVANVRALSDRMEFLEEGRKVHGRLVSLIDEFSCTGKQIHDANIVATMLTGGIETVITANTDDFTRFESLIGVMPL